jgi:acetate kinase
VVGVTLQLGAGCSACAVDGGRSIETSMGFSPLEGLVMATRSGDIDPAVVLELLDRGRTATEVRALLSRGSGLEGLAGNADLRRVLAAEAEGDERARVAVGLFVRRIVMRVGAYLTLLGGRGSLTFGGGIGTHSAEIRQRVADGLVAWNVALDPERNREAGVRGPIGRPGSRPVYVFETDEERLIAVETRALLRPSGPDGPRPVDPSPDPSP